MSKRIIGSFIVFLSASGGLYRIFTTVDPFHANFRSLFAFYVLAFLWVASGVSLLGSVFGSHSAVRRGALLGLLVVNTLWLQSQALLGWWTGLLLLIIVSFLEVYSISH